jgi:hypothetical protein
MDGVSPASTGTPGSGIFHFALGDSPTPEKRGKSRSRTAAAPKIYRDNPIQSATTEFVKENKKMLEGRLFKFSYLVEIYNKETPKTKNMMLESEMTSEEKTAIKEDVEKNARFNRKMRKSVAQNLFSSVRGGGRRSRRGRPEKKNAIPFDLLKAGESVKSRKGRAKKQGFKVFVDTASRMDEALRSRFVSR